MTPDFAAILPAAGSSTRFGAGGGGGGDKLLTDLRGQSVLQRSVALFSSRPDIHTLLLITTKDRFQPYKEHLSQLTQKKQLIFVEGGRERWESVLFGLRHLAALHPKTFVAIHDAARPLTPQSVIDQVFTATRQHGARGRGEGALPCLPEPATLKRKAPDNTVAETVDRSTLFQAQTPQCFALDKLLASYEHLLATNQMQNITDDAQIFERSHLPVLITPGSSINLKITTKEDIDLARAILASQSPPS